MKKMLLRVSVGILAVALCGLAYGMYIAQRVDLGWQPKVAGPAFPRVRPHVLVDEAHYNSSTGGFGGRYRPLARLLTENGYEVRRGTEAFTLPSLAEVDILVIANAAGSPKPPFMGLNPPVIMAKDRGTPAFTAAEIQNVAAWVKQGGSLLLIADHAPFVAASEHLAAAFQIRM